MAADDFPPLIDVTGRDLRELFADQDDNLALTIRRLVAGLDDPDGVISAFQSYATPPVG